MGGGSVVMGSRLAARVEHSTFDLVPAEAGERPARAVKDPVLDAVGTAFAVRHATTLTVMKRAQAAWLGECWVNGHPVTWDYWFPHLAIAVDTTRNDEQVVDEKLAWATERNILYFSPQSNTTDAGRFNWPLLTEVAAERRERV